MAACPLGVRYLLAYRLGWDQGLGMWNEIARQ